jgi:hypothetical protein
MLVPRLEAAYAGARGGARHRTPARARALHRPPGRRPALEGAPAQHGRAPPGHRPARLRPAQPAAGVRLRGLQPVRGDEGEHQAQRRQAPLPRPGPDRTAPRAARGARLPCSSEQSGRGRGLPGPGGGRGSKPITVEEKVGRNEPCPCGSGKKYKHCHGRVAPERRERGSGRSVVRRAPRGEHARAWLARLPRDRPSAPTPTR